MLAEPSGVGFGLARFPHDDDPVQTRTLTYRNTGAEPILLALLARGMNVVSICEELRDTELRHPERVAGLVFGEAAARAVAGRLAALSVLVFHAWLYTLPTPDAATSRGPSAQPRWLPPLSGAIRV